MQLQASDAPPRPLQMFFDKVPFLATELRFLPQHEQVGAALWGRAAAHTRPGPAPLGHTVSARRAALVGQRPPRRGGRRHSHAPPPPPAAPAQMLARHSDMESLGWRESTKSMAKVADSLSPELQDLLDKILTPDEERRLDIRQIKVGRPRPAGPAGVPGRTSADPHLLPEAAAWEGLGSSRVQGAQSRGCRAARGGGLGGAAGGSRAG
jgi:hypothetical protein